MSFNTYIINLKTEPERIKKQIPGLKKTGLDPIVIEAVDGKTQVNNENLTFFCKYFRPFSVIGCALSHYKVYSHFIENDQNDICLVLEDDAFPLFKNKDVLSRILNQFSTVQWDKIQLHCDNIREKGCEGTVSKTYSNSTAAYFVSKKGAQKILKGKIDTHFDRDLNSRKELIRLKTPRNYFYTDESVSSNRKNYFFLKYFEKIPYAVGEKNVSHHLGFNWYRIPFVNININKFQIRLFQLILVISIGIIFISRKKKN